MTNILVLAEALNGVTHWRAFQPFAALRRANRDLNFTFKDRNVTMTDIRFSDLVIAYRPSDKAVLSLIEAAKSSGVPVVVDCDDDLLNMPPTHPLYHDYEANRSVFIEGCAMADRVWTSTTELLYVCDAMDGRGQVVPNSITERDLPNAPAPWLGEFTWRGSSHHIADVLAHAEWYERSRSLANRWIFKGYFPPLNHYSNATTERWEKNTDAYFAALARRGVNVVWKPLAETQFNKSKSNIAWIEATMGGGCCVTNFAGREGWECALPEFPRSGEEVAEAWKASRDHVLNKYHLADANALRLQTIRELT